MAPRAAAPTIAARSTRHYKEPISAATSSFTEGASVFGGQANLLRPSRTSSRSTSRRSSPCTPPACPRPSATTCRRSTEKARQSGKIPEGRHVIYASTPSYVGSHVTGFSNMVKGMLADRRTYRQEKRQGQHHPRLGRAGRHGGDQAPGGPGRESRSPSSRIPRVF